MSENIERTSDTEKITTGNELWATFKDRVPSLQPQREAFLSMLGQVLKTLGFEKVAFYKSRSRKVGYRGLVLKCRVDTFHSQSVENVKSWANSNLLPGSSTDSVNKDDAWTSFAKFAQLDLTENHRQMFFSIFGNHVAGQGPFKVVSSNKKRKSFVGLRLKENEPLPKQGKTEASEEEEKHVGMKEVHFTADDSYETIQEEAFTISRDFQGDCMNSDIDKTYGISSDYMNEREFSNAARITSSGTETNAISAGSNVDAGDSESVDVYEGESTINELDEAATDSTDEEVIDMSDIDLNALSSQGVQACDEDVSTQETIFRRHHKKMKSFMPSHLPGRPKSFKSYLDGIFQTSGSMQGERLAIQKRCGKTMSIENCKLRAFVAASFPPIKVGKLGGNRIPSTFDGDKFPQFSQIDKGSFLCEVCIPFQKWAMENSQPHAHLRCRKQATVKEILAGTATLKFSGLVQVGEHASSECHKQANAFFKAEEDSSPSPKDLELGPSSEAKKASSGQQFINKFFLPLNREGPPDPPQQIKSGKVKCHHYWDPEVVKQFAEDRQIRRWTAKSLFLQQVRSGAVSCYASIEGHDRCNEYKQWIEKHPIDARQLIEKANSSCRSVYIPNVCTINVYGNNIQINGCIKSIDPPCTGEAQSSGESPFTCMNCAKQQRDLKDVLRHRNKGSLGGVKDRIGVCGFNQRYAKTLELKNALKAESRGRKEAERHYKELTRVKLSRGEWEKCLMDSCLSCDEEKLVIDLMRLFKMGISKTKPVQLMVLYNLISKLLKKNNNHYLELVKDISSLFKNELGPTKYSLLADMFGLAGETTATKHGKQERLDAGINHKVIESAARHYRGFPVNEASDGARSLRYLQPRLTNSGEVVILGKMWNADVQNWSDEILKIPRRDASKGDKDDYDALKRLVDDLLNNDQLAKSVSIHNFTGLGTVEKQSLIYCIWPTPEKGYNACHLLKYWEHLRRLCFYAESGDVRDIPINLLTYSTDSAGFSLSAANKLMKPSKQEVEDGVVFLGLGVDGEKYLAPYYWNLPSIACLDYDHEQRLFLKNLKYETRDLIFWIEDGKITRLATIQHLHDLKNRCQNLGLDCGFTATDLLLVFFCDQNSDACERLFTSRIADLLDEHIPGSKGTSLYIRAVCRLIDPFRKIDFGSPAEIQASVSSAITIIRLWRRVLELKKMLLHSKPGAKTDPSKRGKFVTNGCYITAEILFAAATLYQLAMFLHFRDVGLSGSSLFNTGTKSTERIISELQGKTNEIQSLDSQPTLADMLDKSSKVQFNINAKQRLAQAGANVKQSSNRRQRAYAFQKHASNAEGSYQYPLLYRDFQEEQKQSHFRGVRDGQGLFEKYMPAGAVELLKENDCWEIPYSYQHPADLKMMEGSLSENYNMLHKTYAEAKDSLGDVELDADSDEKNQWNNDDSDEAEEREKEQEEEKDAKKEEESEAKGSQWKITKIVGNKTTYIHIKQALKLILPREYIARCRQKRHWASKYLPGRAPIDPKHDIVKFSNVALKSVQQGQRVFDIARVEDIQSANDGSQSTSFKLKGDTTMRCRFSFYQRSSASDTYHIHPSLGFTNWRPSSSILGAVELIPDMEDTIGCYILHEDSKKRLDEMGYICRGDFRDNEPGIAPNTVEDQAENPLPDDFYEIDNVLERRLSKDTLTYEYRVRFKGYCSEDDMWLPASYFNRAVNYESVSTFGRKRKHKIDPDSAPDLPEKKSRAAPSEEKMMKREKIESRKLSTSQKCKKEARVKNINADAAPELREKKRRMAPLEEDEKKKKNKERRKSTSSQKRKTGARVKRKVVNRTSKGKMYRSSLPRGKNESMNENSATKEESSAPVTDVKCNKTSVINVEEISQEGVPKDIDVLADVLSRDDNFRYPRRMLCESTFPRVDSTLVMFSLSDSSSNLTDPISVTKLPPQSVLEKIEKELSASQPAKPLKAVVQFATYGNFNIEGIRVLKRFHRLKRLRAEVSFEKTWLEKAFKNTNFAKKVAEALLDRWNLEGNYLASYDNYRISSQELSLLCGERYLSDEIINFLGQKYCDKANEESQMHQNILLPSYLSTGNVLKTVVERICHQNDMESVANMFLPVHMNSCHWGLAMFSIKNKTVFFDDGYHCPIPQELKQNANRIIDIIFQTTGNDKFNPSSWCDIRRFIVPLPDQPSAVTGSPEGSGSCGVAVICAIRDLCNGKTGSFSWTYQDATKLRAELMLEILDLRI